MHGAALLMPPCTLPDPAAAACLPAQVLSDDNKKAIYDQYGEAGLKGGMGGFGGGGECQELLAAAQRS
jgi:hypothetical protein